jgi:hypothetical protein
MKITLDIPDGYQVESLTLKPVPPFTFFPAPYVYNPPVFNPAPLPWITNPDPSSTFYAPSAVSETPAGGAQTEEYNDNPF